MNDYDLLSKDGIKSIVINLIERAKENIGETKNRKEEYYIGYRMACYEFLDMIKTRIEDRDGDLAEYGLDFNIDSLLSQDKK